MLESLDGVAPSLQATQEKLQRQMNADRVNHSLEKRPSVSELSAQGVLDRMFESNQLYQALY